MATTTPNYGWPVPTNTDYVKDGANAISDLGDAIDATVFGLPSGALTLVKSQAIGTAVSSVEVTGAFSATYDNYLITISGGVASQENVMRLQLGATTTGYYWATLARSFGNVDATVVGSNAANIGRVSGASTTVLALDCNIQNPFLTKRTVVNYAYVIPGTTGHGGAGSGFLNDDTSYTAFTISPPAGTYTGGTIFVYGYKK